MSAHWSIGVLVGAPLLLILFGALAGFGVWLLHKSRTADAFDMIEIKVLAIAGLSIAGLVAVLSILGFYPYKGEYHQWRPVQGTVTQVSSRIISDGSDSVNQRFVLKVGDGAQLYGCDDTRCATVKVGDMVALLCKREWQYASVSGYGCRWAS